VRDFLEESLVEAFAVMAPWGIQADDPENGRKAARILADARPGDLPDLVKMTMLGHFPLPVRLSERLWPIPRDAGLRAVLRDALGGDELYMHMPPTARFVLPGNDRAGVPAHQDISYNHHLPEFFTVWVPLVEIDEACGGMSVFEGSQNGPEMLSEYTHDQWLKPVTTAGFKRRVCAPMSPGDIIIFNKWIIHESMLNRSTRSRLSVDHRFFGPGGVSRKHALDMQTWRVLQPAVASA
jgi:ectoine hydroxylase-related dioxygenase (phytanoyl-CoA dioxygenase family)